MKKYLYLLTSSLVSLVACNEESVGQYPIDTVPPKPVTEVSVKETFGGGAIISYQIPDDIDLMGVKAYYTLDTGKKMEVMASAYEKEISIEGYAVEEERTVELRAIDKSRNESEPVYVKITPKPSPIYAAFESLKIYDDFGGIQVQWDNPEEKDIIVMVSKPIKEGSELTEGVQNFYSSAKAGIGYVRGFDAVPQTFCVEVSDKWGNKTEMISQDCLPLYEEELQRKQYWKKWNPSDIPYRQYSNTYKIELLWDNVTMEATGSKNNFFHTPAGDPFPVRFTFDMRQVYKLSRLKLYQRGDKWVFTHGNFKKFTIYGSLSDKVRMDATEPEYQWIKLGDFESVKPSGLPLGQYTEEDRVRGAGGEDFNFPIDLATPVRYIRFDVHETWGGTEMIHAAELRFWGSPEELN